MPIACHLRAAALLFTLLFALCAPGQAHARQADGAAAAAVTLRFDSVTPLNRYELVHRSYRAAATTVTGVLSLPSLPNAATGTPPLPAMVIMHGSAGLQAKDRERWVPLLNHMGIATLLVNSFTPRGIGRVDEDQAKLDQAANDADALAALRLLGADRRIDPKRIGVIGFSRGGIAALETAVEAFRAGLLDNDVRFAAHIAFYPGCGLRYWRTPSPLTGAPIMMALAGRDDYVPAAPCLAFADAMRAAGQDVEVHVYPNAFHDFDNTVDYVKRGDRVETSRACADREIDPLTWRYTFLKTGESFTDYAGFAARLGNCVTRGGVTTASDRASARQAERDVQAFLRRVFKLQAG